MGAVLAITGPIYLSIAVGWASARAGLFNPADLRSLGQFVLRIALPALLIEALTSRSLGQLLQPTYLLGYALGSLAAMGLMAWLSRAQGLASNARVVRMMGVSCSNSGYVGYPMLLLVHPDLAGTALALNMLVENLLILPLLLLLAEHGQHPERPWREGLRHAGLRVLRHPLTLAMGLGLAVSVSGWSPPDALRRTVHLFALASTGVSLFVIGANLVGLRSAGLGRAVTPIVLGKLLIHPTAVALALFALGHLGWAGLPALSPALWQSAVLLAAVPMLGIYPILAQTLGQGGLAAAAMLATTLASFVSLNALLAFLAV